MAKGWRLTDTFLIITLAAIAVIVAVHMACRSAVIARVDDAEAKVAAMAPAQKAIQASLNDIDRTVVAALPPSLAGKATETGNDKRGDWLVRILNSEPRTLNPVTSKDAYASIVNDYLFDNLIEVDPDTLEYRGKMAESWTIRPGYLRSILEVGPGKTWYLLHAPKPIEWSTTPLFTDITFRLRDGMLWSDGLPITSDDVVFSFGLIKNPEVDAANIGSYFKDVESVVALDPLTVRFRFSKPYFEGLEVAGAGYMTIIPRHAYTRDSAKEFNSIRDYLIGSGPYVFEYWNPGQEIAVRRNDRYYGAPPNFDRIVFRIVRDETAAFQMLMAGEIDRMSLTSDQYLRARDNPDFTAKYGIFVYSSPGSGYSYIAWNNVYPLFDDARVRRALTHLVPRDAMRMRLFNDLVEVVTGPFWPGSPEYRGSLQYDRSIEPWPYDPAMASALLAEAGWRDTDGDGILDREGVKFKFSLLIPSGSERGLDIAGIVKEEMGRVGIEVEIKQLEWTVFVGKLDTRDYAAISLGWTGSLEGDPYQIWHSDSIPNQGSNHVHFDNSEADRLIEAARVEFDREKRNQLYHQFDRILHEEQPYTFLFHGMTLAAVSKRFSGVKLHVLGLDDKEWWTPAGKRIYTK